MEDYPIFNGRYYVDNDDKIVIGKTDECVICGCYFKYRKMNINYAGTTPEGLYEVVMRTEHPRCRQIKNKMDKAQQDILDAEFELFCKRFGDVKYNR
jgi:hypothetical protein